VTSSDSEALSHRERQETITQLLVGQDHVTVRDLAERFNVSAMTIHRDLDALESIGVLRKVRGGATAQPTALYESSLTFRLGQMPEAKRRLAELAAERIKPGASVALDDSTTALALLPFLAEIGQLTVVTYFASVVEEVARLAPDTIELVVVGGTYSHKYHAFVGVLAEQQLMELSVDHSFISVSSVDVERGTFHQEPDQAAIKRTLVHIARDSSLLVDSTKFRSSALHRVVALPEFNAIYVDDSTSADIVRRLRQGKTEVHVAGGASTGDAAAAS
jgi:DeoR/GlpR family transcriptional regulator of sugar metabolism